MAAKSKSQENPLEILSLALPKRPQEKRCFGNLYGVALPLCLAAIEKEHSGVVMVVVPDSLTASKLERELSFFLKEESSEYPILSFPDWETLPYDSFSPHQDIVSERLTTLYHLPNLTRGILIVPVNTLMQRLCPKEYLYQNTLLFRLGEVIDLEAFRQNLAQSGYRAATQVMEHGEFAIRGSLIDLFPMGSEKPFRIDLFDNVIDSIRTFDIETQRSLEKIEEIRLLPAREFPLSSEGISSFRNHFRDRFEGDPRQSSLYVDVSEGIAAPGLEYFLPLFFEKTSSLFEYLPKNCLIAEIETSEISIEKSAEQFWEEVKERYEQYRHDRLRPILDPKLLFLQPNELFAAFKQFPVCELAAKTLSDRSMVQNLPFEFLPDLSTGSPHGVMLGSLQGFLTEFEGRILFTAETAGRREILKETLSKIPNLQFSEFENFRSFLQSDAKKGLIVAPIDEGVIWDIEASKQQLAIIPEAALFGKRVMQRRLRKTKSPDFDFEVRSLAELSIGAPVVHLDYGIGRYLGLTRLTLGGQEAEFLTLEYVGGDKLYVPVTSLNLVSRYSGVDLEHAPIGRLGSDHWEKVKKRVLEQTRDVAVELLEIYAKREAKVGHSFPAPDEQFASFEDEFPFEETPDQNRAILEVIKDLTSSKPMDRVICGDVGFGKTEVALRAAFIAVAAGKQVAVLVPTTLLADQHFQTFSDRFANFGVRLDVLSRFKNRKEQEKTISDLSEGKLDIIIGTHKLLQDTIKFKNLGLLIIDEEHRFGVRQKEQFKKLRSEVDILTLTATPIPRTLNMSMSGLRDLSIIATPPAKRLSIKTFVREKSPILIQEAIHRELHRGGQVYYLHNEVETIENAAHELQNLVPSARIAIAHGQMRERELEHVMSDFYHRRFNVLVCTTIIETGIDIPTANTIIIDRADKFGLAQLHQLRGRVGRSHHQAYAFCLTPSKTQMTSDAKKRLEAIESLGELGAGFTLATHDLEIRGAGELLGEEQSGNIQAVGFPLFMELLDNAVKLLQKGEDISLDAPLKKQVEIDSQHPHADS